MSALPCGRVAAEERGAPDPVRVERRDGEARGLQTAAHVIPLVLENARDDEPPACPERPGEAVEEGLEEATIMIAPFKVTGTSSTRPGARRAALYKAEEVYRSYHPSYRIQSPFPDEFVDQNGTKWTRLAPHLRHQGDYEFSDEDGDDYTDIETMLLWDIRVGKKS